MVTSFENFFATPDDWRQEREAMFEMRQDRAQRERDLSLGVFSGNAATAKTTEFVGTGGHSGYGYMVGADNSIPHQESLPIPQRKLSLRQEMQANIDKWLSDIPKLRKN